MCRKKFNMKKKYIFPNLFSVLGSSVCLLPTVVSISCNNNENRKNENSKIFEMNQKKINQGEILIEKIINKYSAFNIISELDNDINHILSFLKNKPKKIDNNVDKWFGDIKKSIEQFETKISNFVFADIKKMDEHKYVSFFNNNLLITNEPTDLGRGFDSDVILKQLLEKEVIDDVIAILKKYFAHIEIQDNNIKFSKKYSKVTKDGKLLLCFENNNKFCLSIFDEIAINNVFDNSKHHFDYDKKLIFWNGEIEIKPLFHDEIINKIDADNKDTWEVQNSDWNELIKLVEKSSNQKLEKKLFLSEIVEELSLNFFNFHAYNLEESSLGHKIEYALSKKSHPHGKNEYHFYLEKYDNGQIKSRIQWNVSIDKNRKKHDQNELIDPVIGNLKFKTTSKTNEIQKIGADEFDKLSKQFAKEQNYFVLGTIDMKQKIQDIEAAKLFDNLEKQKLILEFLKKYFEINGDILETDKYRYYFDFAYGHNHGSHNYHFRVFVKNLKTNEYTYPTFFLYGFKNE